MTSPAHPVPPIPPAVPAGTAAPAPGGNTADTTVDQPAGVGPDGRTGRAGGPGEAVRDRAVVRLTDATFRDGMAELRGRLREQILSGVRVLVVDVSAVRRLSSTAVAALLGAHRACRARGGGVIIRNPNRRTLDLLRRTGLWRVLRPEFTEPESGRTVGSRPEGH